MKKKMGMTLARRNQGMDGDWVLRDEDSVEKRLVERDEMDDTTRSLAGLSSWAFRLSLTLTAELLREGKIYDFASDWVRRWPMNLT